MSDTIIKVENLSKCYRIGAREQGYKTFREAIIDGFKAPFKNLRRLRRLTKFDDMDLKSQSTTRNLMPSSQDDLIWALNDVSFEVKRGDVLGIIGRNGAGKTTLLKILSRITEPTSGGVKLFGRVSTLLEVGTGFHPELSGRENIYLNGAILGMNKAEIGSKFDEIVDFAEIEKFLDTPVKRYSSGMYVRLAFAVAAHLEPEIMLVDEVLAVGDAAFQRKCLGKMGDVAKEGRTVLFVSHNMIAIKSLCPRTIWLHEGQIKKIAESDQAISGYLQSNASPQTEQVWDDIETAPGNDIIRLHRMSVRVEDGLPSDLITTQTSFIIKVEYWNLVPDTRLNINLHLITEEQIVAFSTSTVDEPGWWAGPLPAGLYRSVCHIPANFLNSGMHRVTLIAVKDQSRAIYRYESVLSFDVLDLGGRSWGWYGKGSGVVSPILEWTTEHIDSRPPVTQSELTELSHR